MKFSKIHAVFLSTLMLVASMANAGQPVAKAVQDKLIAALESGQDGLEVATVATADIPGMFEVTLVNGPILYATADGSHFVVGDLYAVTPQGYVNLAEKRRDATRVERLASVSTDDMIVFPAQGEPRGHISIFTDVTCYYCQKLHQEVPELNKRGIEVRYLAYPRAGVDSEGFEKLATAWCSDNPQEALTKLKNKQSVPGAKCANPIADQYQLGQELGVRGTPAIITQEGKMIPGYQSASDLMVSIGLN